jgi:hypothetical protein
MSDTIDERFPISDCCAVSLTIEDSESSFGIVCGRCMEPCRAVFNRNDYPYIEGDKIPDERLRGVRNMRGVHNVTVEFCSLRYIGSDASGRDRDWEVFVAAENGKTYFVNSNPSGELSEAMPF